MSQSQAPRLISKLRYNLRPRRKLKQPDGPKGRHERIRKIVTALFKHERIECKFNEGDESRGYAERLLSDAIRYGDCHTPTMEMASYWLLEKQLIHKLFKVMVPKYRNYDISYTKMWKAPNVYPSKQTPNCILEFRNNVYPPLGQPASNPKNLIHNILLQEAKKFFETQKLLESKETTKASQTTQPTDIEKPVTSEEESSKVECKESSSAEVDQKIQQGEDTTESLDLDKLKIKEETSSSVEKEK